MLATLDGQGARLTRALVTTMTQRRQRLRDLARALPRPERLTEGAGQRLDQWAGRLAGALGLMAARKRGAFDRLAAGVRAQVLAALVATRRDRLADRAARLTAARTRAIAQSARDTGQGRVRLAAVALRLHAAPRARLDALTRRLSDLDRMRQTLGHAETLRRGYAVVRGDGAVVTSRDAASRATALEVEFHDGRLSVLPATAAPKTTRKPRPGGTEQGSLF